MEKHLICIDLDGTLLNDESKISNKSKQVIEKLVDKGHLVVLATGRPYHATIEFYRELNLETPLITDNGGNIQEPHNSKFQVVVDGIPVKIHHQIFNFTKEHLVSAFYSYYEHVYAYKFMDRLHKIFMGGENANIIHGDFNDFEHTPTGMIYLVDNSFQTQFENYIKNDLYGIVNYRLWGADSKHAIYELYKYGSSKLSAINWVADHFSIDKNNIIAFGDGLNDIEMISGVKLGVAMPNGLDVVKKAADDMAPDTNDNDGVAKYLIKYFNIK